MPNALIEINFFGGWRLARGHALRLQGLEAGDQSTRTIRRYPAMPDEDHRCVTLPTVLAHASLTGREISLELTQEVLKNVIDQDAKAVTIETIQRFVSDYYQLKVADLKSRNNSKSVAMPRQIAMYLCKSLTNASLPEIGRSFGGKHHSTVIHSLKKIEDLRKRDGDFNSLISNFLESIR